MPNYRQKREKMDQKRLNEQLVAMINDEKSFRETEFAVYYRKCKTWYDLYRGIFTQNYHGFRNSMSIPFLYSVVQSDVARKMSISFNQFPYVQFENYPIEAEAIARKNDLLIGVQMEDMRIWEKAVDFFTTADLYGVGIMRDGWRQDRCEENIRVPSYERGGKTSERLEKHWFTYFDGPDCRVVDTLDFYPQPGVRYISDMTGIIDRSWRDLDDMKEQVAAEIAAGEEPSWDPEALDEVERMGFTSKQTSDIYERNAYARTSAAWSNRTQRYHKPVEIWSWWGKVPSELAPDGDRNRHIDILNAKVMGKNEPSPYHHKQIPYSSFSIGDPHFFHGVGKTELLSKLQAASNRIMNHKLDSLDLSISPAIIAGANTGVDSSRPLHMTPGKIIQLDTNTVGDDVIRPFAPNMQGIQAAGAEIQTLWMYMQQGSGIIEDTISGGSPGVEQTAHEFAGRQAAVMTRLTMESHLAEKSWLEPLANRMRALNRQFLSVPKQVNMIGNAAVTDPETGEQIVEDIDYSDLWPDYKARAVGATTNMLHLTGRQDTLQFIQMASSNPGLLQAINWNAFAREVLPYFGVRNVSKVLQQMQPGLADYVQQLQGGGNNGGGSPAQPPAMSSTPYGPGPLQNSPPVGGP